MNIKELKTLNEIIRNVFLRTEQNPDLVTIEGTVDTGFEKVALEELLLKQPKIAATDYCSSPGRIYFNIKISEINQINELRSVDHIAMVVLSENVKFTSNKEEDLDYFRQLANNINVDKVLKIWSEFVGQSINNELVFRVTGIRSYIHSFTSMEAAAIFGGKLNDRFHWLVSMTQFQLEILLYIISDRVTVAFQITKISNHRRNITHFGPTTLRATVCYNLLLLAKPVPGDIILDPLCGGGSIPIECALAFPNTIIFCGDNHEKAIDRTNSNIQEFPNVVINHCAWDATRLPFKDGCVDIIVSDLPFGKRSGTYKDNRILYMKLLHEFGRVVKPNTGRMVLLTNDRRSLLNAINRCEVHFWSKSNLMAVKLGGLKPLVVCFKRNKIKYEARNNLNK